MKTKILFIGLVLSVLLISGCCSYSTINGGNRKEYCQKIYDTDSFIWENTDVDDLDFYCVNKENNKNNHEGELCNSVKIFVMDKEFKEFIENDCKICKEVLTPEYIENCGDTTIGLLYFGFDDNTNITKISIGPKEIDVRRCLNTPKTEKVCEKI